MSNSGELGKIGAVAIGRNEGERLRACLTSLARDLKHVVYVDSGSTDDSARIARDLGVEIVDLNISTGFTAARARNSGFSRLIEIASDVEFLQFVDGDCEIIEGWIETAVEFLRDHADVAVACGRRKEISSQKNCYHRLVDMEWDGPIGEVKYCGGDAFVRVKAFREVGGYRESLIAGEEPELCVRLRGAGWKIWRLDFPMTRHDIRMSTFGQWWKRAVRSGHAYTEGAILHGRSRDLHYVKECRSIWFWTVISLFSLILTWPTRGISLVVLAAMYLLLFVRICRYRIVVHRDSMANSSLYSVFCVLAKWPQAIGSLKFIWNRLTGARSVLIEYGSRHAESSACLTTTRTAEHQQTGEV